MIINFFNVKIKIKKLNNLFILKKTYNTLMSRKLFEFDQYLKAVGYIFVDNKINFKLRTSVESE